MSAAGTFWRVNMGLYGEQGDRETELVV